MSDSDQPTLTPTKPSHLSVDPAVAKMKAKTTRIILVSCISGAVAVAIAVILVFALIIVPTNKAKESFDD